jgi:hypothetical protein
MGLGGEWPRDGTHELGRRRAGGVFLPILRVEEALGQIEATRDFLKQGDLMSSPLP